MNLQRAVKWIEVTANPFCRQRKRPKQFKYVSYTKDLITGRGIEIGEFTYGKPVIRQTHGTTLKIGKFCSIAKEVTIRLGGNHPIHFVSMYPFRAFTEVWPEVKTEIKPVVLKISDTSQEYDVVIGNDVWIGEGAFILPGARIGDGAVVGARSVVTRMTQVDPYSIVAGNPARLIGKRFDDETIKRLLEIKW